jgi:hypothetical protein
MLVKIERMRMMIGYLSNGKNKGSFYGEVVRWMRKY